MVVRIRLRKFFVGIARSNRCLRSFNGRRTTPAETVLGVELYNFRFNFIEVIKCHRLQQRKRSIGVDPYTLNLSFGGTLSAKNYKDGSFSLM